MLACSQPISHLAATRQVGRKCVYQQGDKAARSLDESFAPLPADNQPNARPFNHCEVGLQDEIYQANKPVLVGVDAASTYGYLLKGVEHRSRRYLGMASSRTGGEKSKAVVDW